MLSCPREGGNLQFLVFFSLNIAMVEASPGWTTLPQPREGAPVWEHSHAGDHGLLLGNSWSLARTHHESGSFLSSPRVG